MSNSLYIRTVADAMVSPVVTVISTDPIDSVAKLFNNHRIHAAAVVDGQGVCVGIITSSDIIKFEAVRKDRENSLHHGDDFDSARYENQTDVESQLQLFDQASFQMTRDFQTISPDAFLAEAAEQMWSQSLHHLLILDEQAKPAAILSSLDILRFLVLDVQDEI